MVLSYFLTHVSFSANLFHSLADYSSFHSLLLVGSGAFNKIILSYLKFFRLHKNHFTFVQAVCISTQSNSDTDYIFKVE